MNLQDALDVGTKAREYLEVLQIWGMNRQKAKMIVTRMLELLNDSSVPWKDLTAVNAEETRRFLQGGTPMTLDDVPNEDTKQ